MQVQHRLKRADPVVELPNLVQIQLDSYEWFLRDGLRELLRSFSPITDFTGNLELELVDYHMGEPKYPLEECRDRDLTHEAPIRAVVRLKTRDGEITETDVYLGDLPLMTERGTFIINGAERVVVSQLARSPGVYFKDTMDISGRILYYATIIPNEGAWVEVESGCQRRGDGAHRADPQIPADHADPCSQQLSSGVSHCSGRGISDRCRWLRAARVHRGQRDR